MAIEKHQKEMKSFRKRLGKHISWFDSLNEKSKWDILFKYKQDKFLWSKFNQNQSHFPFSKNIYRYRKMYRIPTFKLRNTILEKILN